MKPHRSQEIKLALAQVGSQRGVHFGGSPRSIFRSIIINIIVPLAAHATSAFQTYVFMYSVILDQLRRLNGQQLVKSHMRPSSHICCAC